MHDDAFRMDTPPVALPKSNARATAGIAPGRMADPGAVARSFPCTRRGLGHRSALLILTLFLSACTMQTTNFDSNTWKSQRGAAAQDNQRGQMVGALEKVVRTSMTRAEVIELLGEPDSSNTETGVDVYELGVSDYGIDEEYFEVRYQDGKVASHRWARR
jgi:hypothetical protein